jgi:hypothetical protein
VEVPVEVNVRRPRIASSLISVYGVQDKHQPSEVVDGWNPRKALPGDSIGGHDIDPVGLFLLSLWEK